VRFPAGAAGDAARNLLPRALRASHQRTCTVSRTIEAGTPVTLQLAGEA
jgi:putative redox protein